MEYIILYLWYGTCGIMLVTIQASTVRLPSCYNVLGQGLVQGLWDVGIQDPSVTAAVMISTDVTAGSAAGYGLKYLYSTIEPYGYPYRIVGTRTLP